MLRTRFIQDHAHLYVNSLVGEPWAEMEILVIVYRYYFTVIFGLHLLINFYHGYSHGMTNVNLTLFQTVYVGLVIFLLPAYGLFLIFREKLKKGAAVFAFSMLAGFSFGYGFHFIFDTPDLYLNVSGHGAHGFFHSAVLLAVIQFSGFFYGFCVWRSQFAHNKQIQPTAEKRGG